MVFFLNFRSALLPSQNINLVTLSIYKMSEAQHDNLQDADGQEQIENITPISQSVLDEIDSSNAEENEDDSIKEKHEIPFLDYEALSMDELTDELEKLVGNEKVMAIKDHVEGIKKAFSDKYHHFIEEKKEEFLAQNIEENLDFEYHFPLKNKFDTIYNSYKSSKTK